LNRTAAAQALNPTAMNFFESADGIVTLKFSLTNQMVEISRL
jgi:hypothetical protein